MSISAARLIRVNELLQEARGLGLQPDVAIHHIAAKMGINTESVTRYLRLLKQEHAEPAIEVLPEPPADPVEVRRHKERAKDAESQLKALEGRLVRAEDIRGEVLGLGAPTITKLAPNKPTGEGRRAVLLHISDIQYGETIDAEEMDGVNSYNIEIANRRIGRYFQKAHRFMTDLWQGKPPVEIVILLNGDMISGALHHELDRTDGARPMVASKMVAQQLIAGISLLLSLGIPIRVINTPGNHGRMTLKPESKDHVLQNFDTLVGWFIETAFAANPLVKVSYSKSIDALFSIFSFPMLATHGDRMGSKGGMGFLGATATILRGHFKLMADYAARGVHLYKIFTGHYHTPAVTVVGHANNTMAGASQYSRDGRMSVTPASQDYFVIEETHGLIEHRQIMVGTPDEGSSHAPILKYRAA